MPAAIPACLLVSGYEQAIWVTILAQWSQDALVRGLMQNLKRRKNTLAQWRAGGDPDCGWCERLRMRVGVCALESACVEGVDLQ
jgi:hypothetical protein